MMYNNYTNMIKGDCVKLPVKNEDIKLFDELYHLLLRQNLTSESNCPKEIKELTSLDISVVNIVAFNPDIIVKEIAEKLNVPNSTLTSSLNRLEKKGIANRTISSRDRRSFGVILTDKGLKLQQIHLEFERTYFESILEKLDTHEERALLLGLLKKIIYGFQADQNRIGK